MLFYLETNSKSCKIYLLATMKHILWFNFIHGSNLFSFVPNSLSYHNQKQKKVKFEPRIKLNHNIYMVCLLFATVYWYKSLQFVKGSNITLLPCLFMILLAVSIIILRLGITFWQELRFCVVISPLPFISWGSLAIIDTDTNEYLPCIKNFVYVELKILEYVLFVVTNRCFSGSEAVKSGLLLQRHRHL